jgi:hypothetical protein
VRAYADDVRARAVPTAEQTYAMADDELPAFRDRSHAPGRAMS